MVVIRPTKDLANRMKVRLATSQPDEGAQPSTNRLGDWYATDLVIARRQFILAISSTSRLSVVLDAAPYLSFPQRLPDAVSEVLLAIGAAPDRVSAERGRMREFRIAKTCDRSLLGSLKEAKFQITAWADHPLYPYRRGAGLLPLSMSLYLSEVPSLVLPETFPKDAALMALASKSKRVPLRLVK